MKVMLLSLIDDYGREMMECNPSYREVLQRLVGSIEGSSCLFGIGVCNDELFDIDNKYAIPIPTQYIQNIDNENSMSSITIADIDNLEDNDYGKIS